MRTAVRIAEVVAALATLAFVVLLFANEPDGPPGAAAGTGPGAAIYGQRCASCHGADGSGGRGPALAQVVSDNLSEAEEITVVTEGRDGMPGFGGRLSPDEIQAVVDYTRDELGTG